MCVCGRLLWEDCRDISACVETLRNLSDVILLLRGGYPRGKMGLLGHNRPFNDVFPWLPVSCLKDEQSFISGSKGQLQFILVS